MLRDNFSAEERAEMVVDGEIEVVCEFCSADYHFKLHEFGDEDHGHDHGDPGHVH